MTKLKKLWIRIVRIFSLREACRLAYGDHFIELYDDICRGIPIGNFQETMTFVDLVEKVKHGEF